MSAAQLGDEFAPFGDDYGPLIRGSYAPIADESELRALPLLRGALPTDLNGVYMRAGRRSNL